MDIERPTDPGSIGVLKREFYFPTPIYFKDLPDAERLNDAARISIYAWRDTDTDGITRSNLRALGSWHSTIDMQTRGEYADLKAHIDRTVAEIYVDCGYDPEFAPHCDSMWANINPRHGYNRGHTHPNVLWSGVYYVQAPPDCGRIYFTDPRPQARVLTGRYPADATLKASQWSEVYFHPIEGRLILFPSWLNHEVQPNLCRIEGPAGDRVSISFNYVLRRVGS